MTSPVKVDESPADFLSLDEAHAVIGASLSIDAAQLKVCRIWPDN